MRNGTLGKGNISKLSGAAAADEATSPEKGRGKGSALVRYSRTFQGGLPLWLAASIMIRPFVKLERLHKNELILCAAAFSLSTSGASHR